MPAHCPALLACSLSPHPHPLQTLPFSACDLAFTLGGAKFNLTALQVDVGGYIADNWAGDGMSYCLNVCKDVTSDRNW